MTDWLVQTLIRALERGLGFLSIVGEVGMQSVPA